MPKNLPHPETVVRTLLQQNLSEERPGFDMQVMHAHFSEALAKSAMKEDTVFVTSIRYPFANYKSRFFYQYHGSSNTSKLLEEYQGSLLHCSYNRAKKKLQLSKHFEYIENPMFRYFFYSYIKALLNQTYFEECLRHIDSTFHVIITELYDESLLLLKHKLCWHIKDIIFIPHKNASFSGKYEATQVDDIMLKNHKNISRLDYELYNYFLRVHTERVRLAGRDFVEELEAYQLAKDDVSQFCWDIYDRLKESKSLNSTHALPLLSEKITIKSNQFWESFSVNGSDCVMMSLCEVTVRKMRMALNYPILCSHQFPGFNFDRDFCASNYMDKTDVFAYDNVYIPYTRLNKMLHCDLTLNYH